jgi:phosphoglycerol transferase MdoB-like AlkP superfamily enzyme
MSNTSNVRNDVKQLAQQIESLAQQVQTTVDQGKDPIPLANELARNSSTFVFTLGALYALEQSGTKSKSKTTVKTTTVSNPSNTVSRNYHNVRDSSGRFARV